MRTNIKLMLALASAMLLAAPLAIAAPHDGDGAGRHGDHGSARRSGMDLAQLSLTDAQRATIKQIEAIADPKIASLRGQVRAQEQAFEALTPGQASYQTAAAGLAQIEAELTQARVIQRARRYAQIYTVLTPSQRARLAELKASVPAVDTQRQRS